METLDDFLNIGTNLITGKVGENFRQTEDLNGSNFFTILGSAIESPLVGLNDHRSARITQ
jgi:hypothetical protein